MNKKDFPIFKNNPNLVYLDSGATSQKPQSVIDRLKKYYEYENANVHRGIYELSENATQEYEKTRNIVKEFINANSEKEIIFTGGTTDSINFVAYSWLLRNVTKGDTVLSTQMEHHSNLVPWQQICKMRTDVNFDLIKVRDNFKLDLSDIQNKIKKFKPILFSFTHVSNVLGTINPVKKIIEIVKKHSPDTRILLDSAQGIPHLPVDVQDLGVDFVAFSGHKVYGPTGIGVLWAKEEILVKEMIPFRYGGGMIRVVNSDDSIWAEIPEKYEAGTPNIADAIGLGEALKYVSEVGYKKIIKHENEIKEYAYARLKEIPELTLFGPDILKNRQGVFSFDLEGVHSHDIAQILADEGVAVRAGHHCCQVLMKSVLDVQATTRASIGIYNDEDDIDKLIRALKKVIGIFK
ncbi:SufS family cysteine desulfurase [Candidatus Dojkabacteria bacterium]|nr:SufS family cysteine desulfurase [Candidatus Dojkabacteria bacterium]